MSAERDAFGARLKRERERRGITLQSVAASTKIAMPLLEALERNDFSRWPQGIYQRGFVRAYVAALGLTPEPLVAEFVRLFADAGPALPVDPADRILAGTAPPQPDARAPLALMLADSPRRWGATSRRVVAVVTEVVALAAVAALVAWSIGASVVTVAGIVAFMYYPLMNAFVGASLAMAWGRGDRSLARRARHSAAAVSPTQRATARRAAGDVLDDLWMAAGAPHVGRWVRRRVMRRKA